MPGYRSDAVNALEAWYTTTRALREAVPGTAEWRRLRMVAQAQREAYESIVDQAESEKAEVGSHPRPADTVRP